MSRNLTDEGRTIIKSDGSEESISARGNWKLWKFLENLNVDEIEYQSTIIKNKLKYETDPFKIRALRRDLLIVSDARRIKKRKIDTEKESVISKGEIKEKGLVLLGQLGFNSTDIYRNELDFITNLIVESKHSESFLKEYDEHYISAVIVTEIFDYYNCKYDNEEILSLFNLKENNYIKLKIIINSWLLENYWNNTPAIHLSIR